MDSADVTNPYASCSDCCNVLCWSWSVVVAVVVVECCCCIPPTCADAGPHLCTFCLDLCILHPDLCTLRLWCSPSINQHKYSTCTHGGGHWLQLALVVFFLPPTGAHTPLALEQLALCGGGMCGGSCTCGSGGMYMKTTRTL